MHTRREMADAMGKPALVVFKGYYSQGRLQRTESKKACHSYFEEQQEGRSVETLTCQIYFSLQQDDEANPANKPFPNI